MRGTHSVLRSPMHSSSILAVLGLAFSVFGCAVDASDAESNPASSESAYSEWGPYGEQLACPAGNISGRAQLIPTGRDYGTVLTSGILVRNTGYNKRVSVVVSTDDFRTSRTVEAHYERDDYPCRPGIEMWSIP